MSSSRPDFLQTDATDLLQQMQSGELTAAQLLQRQLARLRLWQPQLNAATQIYDERAQEEARHPRPGPLSGLPFSVKETLGLAGDVITAGSLRMTPQRHDTDAPVIQALRAAGAIVIARSNVPEFAMTGESSNPRFGRTNNPHDPARVAGGSSGGEGALVGAGISAFGVGSDLLGSIRIPAAFCGVVGFKPASASVDKTGTWPVISSSTDNWLSIGPLARSVRDARLVYNVMARQPLAAPCTVDTLRLLLPDQFPFRVQQSCIADALRAAVGSLRAAGMRPETPSFADVAGLSFQAPLLILKELAEDWKRLLNPPEQLPLSLFAESWRQLTGRGQIDNGLYRWLIQDATLARLVKPHNARQTERLVQRFRDAGAHYQQLLADDGILLLPTLGMVAPPHGDMNRQTLRPGVNRHITPLLFCNYCNLPAISVPAWRHRDAASGLPAAVMLACAPGAEARLLDVAAVVEAALN